jgi:carbon monoxide dehydrogenase subunit G
VYEKKPGTTVDLKQNIGKEVAAIFPNMLQQVMQNFQKRLGECFDNKGRHLTNTVFRK